MSVSTPNDLQIDQLKSGKSHLIEANAGTGKTYAIANLFLRFVLEDIRVQNLLVVTFSNAATDELRGRIRKRLHQARTMLETDTVDEKEDDFFTGLPDCYAKGDERNEAIQRLTLALLDISEAPIYTIHSFCQQALSDQAFSSGQAFELEQTDDNDLQYKTIQDWWRKRTYNLSSYELSQFKQIFSAIDPLKKKLEPVLKIPSPIIRPTPPEDISGIKDKLQNELLKMAKLWQTQGEAASNLLLSDQSQLNRKSHNKSKLTSVINSLNKALCQETPRFPDIMELTAISHNRFKFNKSATDEIQTKFDIEVFKQAEELLIITQEAENQLKSYELNNACTFIQQQVTTIKQQQGLLSFDDMISYLHHALHNNEDSSNALAARLASRYPLILIDEFQDTDPLQYAIFNRIHKADSKHTLIMIGDPKQAIYGFRGGDIFTYMQARRETNQHWSLSTNWRSTPEMIEAVNTLFNTRNTFTYADIPYNPSQSPHETRCTAQALIYNDAPVPALTVQKIPLRDNGSVRNKNETYAYIHQAVAQRIAELLASNTAYIGKEKLQPADIAILVQNHHEAKSVRQALLDRGIRAVSAGKDNIWTSDEANGLRLILEAALLPDDRNLLRQAATAPFLNLSADKLLKLTSSPSHWGAWVELIYKTGNVWKKRGFMPAFQSLLQGLAMVLDLTEKNDTPKPAAWLLNISNPERCLTNLFHLAELLQQASKEHAGGEQLLTWMIHQQNITQKEEHQLRLESDEELVKITTIHTSKGLEFPVVFAPYLWYCKPRDSSTAKTINWHEETNEKFQHFYMPWFDKNEPMLIPTDHERLAEDLRLTYVALTRASSHCHIFFGPAGSGKGDSGHTAISWLLSGCTLKLDEERFDIKAKDVSLNLLEGKDNINVIPPRDDLTPQIIETGTASDNDLEAASIDRKIRTNWQIGSYSAMTRNVHQTTRITSKSNSDDFALNYKAGANVGNFLHKLLEFINPAQNILPQLKRLLPSLLIRYNQDSKQEPEQLAVWLYNILHTPLDDKSLILAGINPAHRLCELEFSLSTRQVDCKKLDTLLRKNNKHQLPPLDFKTFQGMLTGVIDLVFEHEGKYYLADYKSNLLGLRIEDYTPDILSKAIANRRYDLQYLIYTLALHRHLRQRIPNYDYQHHFGGVYYLFLRAMRPQTGNDYGIYFSRPNHALIRQLDEEIFAFELEKTA